MDEEKVNVEETVTETEVEKETTPVEEPKQTVRKKKNGALMAVLIVLILALIGGCLFVYRDKIFKKDDKKDNQTEVETKKAKVYDNYRLSGNALEEFDLYFLKVENPGKNAIYSPLSIKYALEMLGEGASGDAKDQIDGVIGDYVAKKYKNDSHMSFANALFVRDSFKNEVKKEYIDLLKSKYNAELILDSFKSPSNINKWISEKTFKLIPELVDDVSDKDFFIVNALAIDMEWVNKIQEEWGWGVSYPHRNFGVGVMGLADDGYTPMNFNGDGKDTKSVKFVAVANRYDIISDLGEDNIRKKVSEEFRKYAADEDACFEDDDAKNEKKVLDKFVAELKEGYKDVGSSTDFYFNVTDDVKVFAKDLKQYNGMTLQYVAIMPTKKDLKTYINDVSAAEINTLIDNLKDIRLDSFEDGVITSITGQIPLFDFDYKLDLMGDLKKIGITDIFESGKANLTGIVGDSDEYIETALHQATIEFSNEGIKAAAATAMGGSGAADCGFDYLFDVPVKNIDMTFDKPFMFIIRDKKTGEVWFAGNVYQGKPMSKEDYWDAD